MAMTTTFRAKRPPLLYRMCFLCALVLPGYVIVHVLPPESGIAPLSRMLGTFSFSFGGKYPKRRQEKARTRALHLDLPRKRSPHETPEERLDSMHERWSVLLDDFLSPSGRRENSTTVADDSLERPVRAGCGGANFTSRMNRRKDAERGALLPILVDKVGGKEFARRLNFSVPATYFETRAQAPAFPPKGFSPENAMTLKGTAAASANYAASLTISRARAVCRTIPEIRRDCEGAGCVPPHFALKATHHSGCNLLVLAGKVAAHRQCRLAPAVLHQRGLPQKLEWEDSLVGVDLNSSNATDSRKALVEVCTNWLAQSYIWENEWAYQQLLPGLVIEEVLWDGGAGVVPAAQDAALLPLLAGDVKCFAFDGRVPYVQHVMRRFEVNSSGAPLKRDTFYEDPAGNGRWRVARASMPHSVPAGHGEELAPEVLTRARQLCRRLSRGIPFVRVDLYLQHGPPPHADVDHRLQQFDFRFGEMTLYAYDVFVGELNLNEELGKWWCDSS